MYTVQCFDKVSSICASKVCGKEILKVMAVCDENGINISNNRTQSSESETTSNCKNYDEAVELTGHGWYNYIQLWACSVISNAVGVDMFGFGVVVAAAACDLRLGVFETALLASVPFAGILFAFSWGYYADTRGRRRALLLSTSVGFLFAVLSSFSNSWQLLLAFKFVGCSFSTAAFNLTITYLGECTGNLRRSRYMFIINSAELAAEIVFYSLAFILRLDFSVPVPWLDITLRPWRAYSLALAAPLGLGAFLLLFLHESPKFLASRGKETEALKVLTVMYETNGGKKGEYPVKIISVDNVDVDTKDSWRSIVNQTVPIFQAPLLCRTMQLFYLIAICCATNYVFVMWYPLMINEFFKSFSEGSIENSEFCQRIIANSSISVHGSPHETDTCDGISTNTIYAGLTLGAVFALLNAAASAVASYRRLVLMASLLVSGSCLVLVNLTGNSTANIIFFTLIQCTAIGIGSIASYFVDLYPTVLRGMVTSFGLTAGRLVSFGGVNLVGATITTYCSLTFYAWAVFVFSGVLIALLLPSDRTSSKEGTEA